MKGRSKAQQLRLLIDDLERTAAISVNVVADLPELEGKAGELLPKTPDGIRALIKQLKFAYEVAKEEQNGPTAVELKFLAGFETARDALKAAREAYKKAMEGHTHRVRLEDPEIDERGATTYPDHPSCVACEETLRTEWYCPKSPDLRCAYPNVVQKPDAKLVRGYHLAHAKHDGDIECVFCGETWTRVG